MRGVSEKQSASLHTSFTIGEVWTQLGSIFLRLLPFPSEERLTLMHPLQDHVGPRPTSSSAQEMQHGAQAQAWTNYDSYSAHGAFSPAL